MNLNQSQIYPFLSLFSKHSLDYSNANLRLKEFFTDKQLVLKAYEGILEMDYDVLKGVGISFPFPQWL